MNLPVFRDFPHRSSPYRWFQAQSHRLSAIWLILPKSMVYCNQNTTEVVPLKTRLLAAFLSLLMLFTVIPVEALCAESDLAMYTDSHSDPQAGTEADALFTQYAAQTLYSGGISLWGSYSGDMLKGNERILYDALVPMIRQIASGQRASTSISVGQDVTDNNGDFYPADVSAVFPDATLAGGALARVMAALVSDLPYELYWYDKVTGCKMFYFRTSKSILQITLQFHVADNYQGSGTFCVDTVKAGVPSAAAAYAASIVESFADQSDYRKLLGYKNSICELTDYNFGALNMDFSTQVDPWQLIYVFDRDPDTKVVCEGYAKAFQYLCDLTDFQSDVICISVPGLMDGESHMWNIVSIEGKSFLADITNSDHGAVDYDSHLFLVGGGGNIAQGYLVGNFRYSYDEVCPMIWGSGRNSILNLSDKAYSPDGESCSHKATLINQVEPGCTKAGYSGDSVCAYCGVVLAEGEVIPSKGHTWDSGTREESLITFTCGDCGTQYSLNIPEPTETQPTEPDPTETQPTEPKPTEPKPTESQPTEPRPTEPEPSVSRVFGADRYATAFQAADTLRELLGVEKFPCIIVACGTNFPDALAGTYLAAKKSAPILLVKGSNVAQINAYIQNNLAQGGTVYLLGGSSVVPDSVGRGIPGTTVRRLGGANRYDTNLQILREAGVTTEDIVICTGKNFADSLSVSAVGLPILLVKDGLTEDQKDFLAATSGKKIITGGTAAVNSTVERQLAVYGSVIRLAGTTRYETSILVAKAFFPKANRAVLAYAQNFPDGLSGGPLAYSLSAPLILTATGKDAFATAYTAETGIRRGLVLGGSSLISDETVSRIFGTE